MRTEIETIASIIPSVRAEIARELVQAHKMSQSEVSALLGVSQPAVSQYVRRLRGHRRQEDFVRKEVGAICEKLVGGRKNEVEDDIYRLCKAIIGSGLRRNN